MINYYVNRLILTTVSFIFCVHIHCSANEGINSLILAAKDQVGKTIRYNPCYQKMSYPLGDVPLEEGVCTDVIIRAFRALGMDLQKQLHEDMKSNWGCYPKKWGLKGTDTNIDHRRVPNLMTYFKRKNMTILDGKFEPGDIVVWDLGGGILHIGLLSNQMVKSANGRQHPLVFHNIARGVQEEDILKSFIVIGHYRLKL